MAMKIQKRIGPKEESKKIVHVLTKFTNWKDLNYDSFLRQNVSHLPIPKPQERLKDILEFIKVWDDFYNVPFFEFRATLQSIAQSSFDKVGFDDVIELAKLDKYIETAPENSYFLISDDDDWYHPDIGRILRDKTEEIVSWDDGMISPVGKYGHRSSRKGYTFWTNSWAMKKEAYLKVEKSQRPKLNYHITSSRVFFPRNSKNKNFTHCFLPNKTRYSIACKSNASYCKYGTSLKKNRGHIIGQLRRWKDQYQRPKCTEGVEWAKGHFNELSSLYDRLFQ